MSATNPELHALVTESLARILTDQKKEELVKKAIEYLVTQPTDRYSVSRLSPLEEAWNWTIRDYATQCVKTLLAESPDLTARIQARVTAGIEMFMSEQKDVSEKIAKAIAEILTERNQG